MINLFDNNSAGAFKKEMTEETKQKLRSAGREDLILIEEINLSGYAGMNRMGTIVDRRFFPDAVPVQKNTLLNIPEPKPIIVLTLKQPWASLIFHRINDKYFAKMWETRSWKTKFRGTLHIHVSKKFDDGDKQLSRTCPFSEHIENPEALPLGEILGFVTIPRIIHSEDWINEYQYSRDIYENEICFGDYSDGRFAWKLENPEPLKTKIKCNGALSIWEYDYETNGPKKKK